MSSSGQRARRRGATDVFSVTGECCKGPAAATVVFSDDGECCKGDLLQRRRLLQGRRHRVTKGRRATVFSVCFSSMRGPSRSN
jgi:hypothetical protein